LLPVQTPIGHFVPKGGIQDEKMLRRKRRFLASHTHLSGFKRGNTSFIRRKKVEYKFQQATKGGIQVSTDTKRWNTSTVCEAGSPPITALKLALNVASPRI